mmetsp:Transcript_57580/g.171709  ORF Transcript_57580/g.171709 Transcript_57580/m.171709 type:complete len:278 (-) Transcript_57580:1242-2075(-)
MDPILLYFHPSQRSAKSPLSDAQSQSCSLVPHLRTKPNPILSLLLSVILLGGSPGNSLRAHHNTPGAHHSAPAPPAFFPCPADPLPPLQPLPPGDLPRALPDPIVPPHLGHHARPHGVSQKFTLYPGAGLLCQLGGRIEGHVVQYLIPQVERGVSLPVVALSKQVVGPFPHVRHEELDQGESGRASTALAEDDGREEEQGGVDGMSQGEAHQGGAKEPRELEEEEERPAGEGKGEGCADVRGGKTDLGLEASFLQIGVCSAVTYIDELHGVGVHVRG